MVSTTNGSSYPLGFTPGSNMDQKGFFVEALVGPAPDGGADDAQPKALQVDTGSCGIAIGSQFLSSYYRNKIQTQGDPALLVTYLPSQNQIWGWWADLPVRLFGSEAPKSKYDPADYPQTTVKVMVASYMLLHGKTRQPFDGGMMGIGFHADQATVRAANPLFSLTVNNQPLSAGYVLTPQGIDIGLNSRNIAGFEFVGLPPKGSLSEDPDSVIYEGPNATLTISYQGTTTGPITCDLLMDTGVPRPMLFTESANIPASLWQPDPPPTPETQPNGTFLPGVSFDIAVSDGVCAYRFTLGQASPFTPPAFMLMNRAGAGSSLNTSIHLLGGYDYCLDYDGKRMGFRSRA
ncbi:hypothetical protein [Telmatospirillum siberiense]|nr:hypothetical protein [Telmatospirillum siberiense]